MKIRRKIGPRGQMSLPKEIQDIMGVSAGEEVYIEIDKKAKEIKIRAAEDKNQFLSNFYKVPKKLKTKIDIEKQIEEEYYLR